MLKLVLYYGINVYVIPVFQTLMIYVRYFPTRITLKPLSSALSLLKSCSWGDPQDHTFRCALCGY